MSAAGWSKLTQAEAAEVRAEVLREAADELDEQLGGTSLASIALRRMAAEAGER